MTSCNYSVDKMVLVSLNYVCLPVLCLYEHYAEYCEMRYS